MKINLKNKIMLAVLLSGMMGITQTGYADYYYYKPKDTEGGSLALQSGGLFQLYWGNNSAAGKCTPYFESATTLTIGHGSTWSNYSEFLNISGALPRGFVGCFAGDTRAEGNVFAPEYFESGNMAPSGRIMMVNMPHLKNNINGQFLNIGAMVAGIYDQSNAFSGTLQQPSDYSMKDYTKDDAGNLINKFENNVVNVAAYTADPSSVTFTVNKVYGVFTKRQDNSSAPLSLNDNTVNVFGGTIADMCESLQYGIAETDASLGPKMLCAVGANNTAGQTGGSYTNITASGNTVNLIGKNVKFSKFLSDVELHALTPAASAPDHNLRNNTAPIIDTPVCVVYNATKGEKDNVLAVYGYDTVVKGNIYIEHVDSTGTPSTPSSGAPSEGSKYYYTTGHYYMNKMEFHLDDSVTFGGGQVMLNYSGASLDLSKTADFDGVYIVMDDDFVLSGVAGDTITLIQSANPITLNDINEDVHVDAALDGVAEVSLEGNNLILTLLQDFLVESGGNTDQQKAPTEAIAAGVAMINQSADLAMGEGMASLLANTDQPQVQNEDTEDETEDENGQEVENNKKYAPFVNTDTFGAITASRSKYQTGSHVDMDGWGVLVGVGQTQGHKHGDKTSYGLFFEYGKGDFDTYNNDIHGEGDSNNKGVGVIARQTLKNNTYIEGNVRYGRQETEWSETDIGSYDTDSRYIGVAVGLGHVYPLENNDELDVYVRYSYGHTGASDAKVKDSDYHFDGVTSKRVRFGAKYNFERIKKAKPYLGLAWEHEMDGECRAVITGVGEAPAPSLKGNTGIMEFGIDWETGDWLLGLGCEAYVGKRKGWSGMARAFYNF